MMKHLENGYMLEEQLILAETSLHLRSHMLRFGSLPSWDLGSTTIVAFQCLGLEFCQMFEAGKTYDNRVRTKWDLCQR